MRSVRNVLRQIFELAIRSRVLAFNACEGARIAQTPRREMQFLSADQVEDLAFAIANPKVKPGGHGARLHWPTVFPEFGLLVRDRTPLISP